MLIRFRDGNQYPNPFNMFDDFFGQDLSSFFGRDLSDFFQRNPGIAMPAVNIQESENNFQIEVAAPGLRKEDFSINVEHNMLTISAQQESRNEENPGSPNEPQSQRTSGSETSMAQTEQQPKSGGTSTGKQSVAQIQASTSMQQNNRQAQRYTRREFSYSSFQRSFTLPETVDPDKITANYLNGILVVIVPKREKQQSRLSRNIQIS